MKLEKVTQRILSQTSGCIAYLKELVDDNRIDDGEVLEKLIDVIEQGPN